MPGRYKPGSAAMRLLALPRPVEVFLQLRCNLLRDVGAGAVEPGAEALLRGGPNDVAVFVDQADGGERLMAALGGVVRFVVADPQAGCVALGVIPGTRARAQVQIGRASCRARAKLERV